MNKFSYLNHIWHDPNCPAWNRNPDTNKEYPHLIKRFGIHVCRCGYDKDFERLSKFIKERKEK